MVSISTNRTPRANRPSLGIAQASNCLKLYAGSPHGATPGNSGAPPAASLSNCINLGYYHLMSASGKGVCGPSPSSLLLGLKERIEVVRPKDSAHSDSVGRGTKAKKEEMAVMRVAEDDDWERGSLR